MLLLMPTIQYVGQKNITIYLLHIQEENDNHLSQPLFQWPGKKVSRSRSIHGRQFFEGKLQRNLFFSLVSGSYPARSWERERYPINKATQKYIFTQQVDWISWKRNKSVFDVKNLFFTTCFSHSTSIDRSRIDDGRHIVTMIIILALIIRMMEWFLGRHNVHSNLEKTTNFLSNRLGEREIRGWNDLEGEQNC